MQSKLFNIMNNNNLHQCLVIYYLNCKHLPLVSCKSWRKTFGMWLNGLIVFSTRQGWRTVCCKRCICSRVKGLHKHSLPTHAFSLTNQSSSQDCVGVYKLCLTDISCQFYCVCLLVLDHSLSLFQLLLYCLMCFFCLDFRNEQFLNNVFVKAISQRS